MRVVPYDGSWVREFEKIRDEIESAIGGLILRVEHVGSTSVPALCAKPCIDIDVVIADRGVLPDVIRGLGEIGYIHEGDLGINGREAFRYTDKPHLATHHLYVCAEDCEELRRHIIFRDFLREDHEAARRYGEVKTRAAELYPDDIDGYMRYKSALIEELYRLCGMTQE